MADRTLSPEDLRAWQHAREQEPGGYPDRGSEMRAWDLSPLEQQKYALQNMMGGIGSFAAEHDIPFLKALDNQPYTRGVAEDLTFLSEFIPGFGDVQGVREGAHTWGEGDRMLGGIMMAASFMPFKSGSTLIKPYKELQKQIDKLKFKRKREENNLTVDGTPAQRSIDNIDNEIRGLTRQQRKLVEDAPPDQLVKPGQDVVPSSGGARPVEGEYMPAGESRGIADMTMDELADVMSGVRLGVPSTPKPKPRQPEQGDMLTRLQNLEMNKPKPKPKSVEGEHIPAGEGDKSAGEMSQTFDDELQELRIKRGITWPDTIEDLGVKVYNPEGTGYSDELIDILRDPEILDFSVEDVDDMFEWGSEDDINEALQEYRWRWGLDD
tara:strand:- start:7970 stop:9109 length:1140 start_codon:yes stop_codon:yes gene_type:complete